MPNILKWNRNRKRATVLKKSFSTLHNQLPFNGTERDPKPEDISQALHLQQSDITTNWETRSGVKGFLDKFLFEKAQDCWNSLDLKAFE